MKVGFIGLGRMGQGMARRILDAGHELAVYDVLHERAVEFGKSGALAASSVAEVARGRDVVITMHRTELLRNPTGALLIRVMT